MLNDYLDKTIPMPVDTIGSFDMKDRSLPKHWIVVGDCAGAVRMDRVEVAMHERYNALVVRNAAGESLNQWVGSTGVQTRPKLFRYLDAAVKAADREWPLFVDHEAAFRLVGDVHDADKPIDALVTDDKLAAVVRAIKVFTGQDATVSVETSDQFRVRT